MSLPQARLWAGLLMRLGGRLVADTHMRSSIIIEGDKLTDALSRFLYSLIDGLAIEFLRLDDAINTLCNTIIRRLVILRHTDGYVVVVQLIYIVVTAVLHASVRVVDQLREVIALSLLYGCAQRVKRILRLQRRAQAPAYHLMRVCIRHQMQITAFTIS